MKLKINDGTWTCCFNIMIFLDTCLALIYLLCHSLSLAIPDGDYYLEGILIVLAFIGLVSNALMILVTAIIDYWEDVEKAKEKEEYKKLLKELNLKD